MKKWISRISPQLLLVGRGKVRKNHIDPYRRLYNHELLILINGKYLVETKQWNLKCAKGEWFIIPPGIPHKTTALTDDVSIGWVHFNWEWHPEIKAPLFVYDPAKFNHALIKSAPFYIPEKIMKGKLSDPDTVMDLFNKLIYFGNSRFNIQRLVAKTVFEEIIIRLFAENEIMKSESQNNLAFKVKYILDKVPPHDIGVKELLSSTLNYSYEHLERLFKNTFRITPLQYITQLRLERIKYLLSDKSLFMADVSTAAGFSSQTYFSRFFKKHTGMTPSKYRKKI